MNKIIACVAAIAALIAAPAFAAPPPVPVYSWTGFYFGVNAGWSWGKDEGTVSSSGPFKTLFWAHHPQHQQTIPLI